MGSGNLGGELRIGMSVLTAVVADDDRAEIVFGATCGEHVLLEDARRSVDNAHEIVVGESLTDDGTPTIGAEMNVCHEASFLLKCR